MNSKTLRWSLKILVGNNYYGFKWITKRFAKRRSIIVNNDTDIMIEGFPRSGNTFAVAAFTFSQEDGLKIARHRHEAGHVMLAVKLNKPILLIIREPMEAVVSLCIREGIDIDYAFKYYIAFYKKLFALKKHMVIVDFREIVTDTGTTIKKVNSMFGTDFNVFEHNDDNVEKVKSIVEDMDRLEIERYDDHNDRKEDRSSHVAFPTEARNKIKTEVVEKIRKNSKYTVLLNNAEIIYNMYYDSTL